MYGPAAGRPCAFCHAALSRSVAVGVVTSDETLSDLRLHGALPASYLYIKVLGTPDPPGPKNLIKTNVFWALGPKTLVFIMVLGPEGQSVFFEKNGFR